MASGARQTAQSSPLSQTPNGVRLTLLVQPRASRSEVVGIHGDALRIRLQAPPADGRANAALVEFLADRLGLPRQAVRLVAGAASRRKVVGITGATKEEVSRRLGIGE